MSTDDTWIVVPAFNEAESIGNVLATLQAFGWNVVVIDDGSSDDTSKRVMGPRVHLCRHVINLGQGAALQTGICHALHNGARYIVTYDADGQHQPEDVENLLRPIVHGGYDVALGTRFAHPESIRSVPATRRFLLRMAAAYTRWTVRLPVTDTHNGLRAFSAEAAAKLHIVQNRMSHATEILQQIRLHGLKYVEVPVHIRYTDYSVKKGQSGLNAVTILCDSFLELLRT